MSTATPTRPRPGATTDRSDVPGTRWVRRAVTYLVALAVICGGTWGLLVLRGGSHEGHADGAIATVDLPYGTLRVDGLVDKQVGHVMPGMSVSEDVPKGMRRFAVNVTLGATADRSLAFSRRDFLVWGPGVRPVAPVDGQIDRGVLTAGRAISGSLSFDVPKNATSLLLRFRDGDPVALPDIPPVASPTEAGADGAGDGHGAHGKGQNPDEDAATEAKKEGNAVHSDPPGAPAHDH